MWDSPKRGGRPLSVAAKIKSVLKILGFEEGSHQKHCYKWKTSSPGVMNWWLPAECHPQKCFTCLYKLKAESRCFSILGSEKHKRETRRKSWLYQLEPSFKMKGPCEACHLHLAQFSDSISFPCTPTRLSTTSTCLPSVRTFSSCHSHSAYV